ncbi:DUF1491 family protein [Pararhodospirillum oryzae]|uniref:GTP-binding protein Era n=1 Tax=Pararhodospirillum oryzae TaxID=478448 RepID=A0A512HA54_9PROT|nr:DUF1491 family protein [Pararhodospirillum oryzae]GEO82343.1 hypothetical protein ROR02_24740 [Pararhodospirillum oryzae]
MESPSPPRPTARLVVAALLRRCHAHGTPAFQVVRGDPDAGTVFIKLNGLARGCVVLAPVRDGQGQAAWLRATGPEPVDETVADAYLDRQRRTDPDLWVVEVEDPALTPPVDAPVL